MSELIRLHKINEKQGLGQGLQNFSMNIRTGEILGILGNRYSGKREIFSTILGERIPQTGFVFYKGNYCKWEDYIREIKGKIVLVDYYNMLIDDLSICDNIKILWRTSGHVKYVGQRNFKKIVQTMLRENRIKKNPDCKVGKLTPTEKLIISIIALSHKPIELILIDSYGMLEKMEDIEKLYGVLKDGCSRGITFLIFGYKVRSLAMLADRLLYLRDGCGVKYMQYSMSSGRKCFVDQCNQMVKEVFDIEQYPQKQAHQAKKKEVILSLDMNWNHFKKSNLQLYAGNFLVVIAPYPNFFQEFRKAIEDKVHKTKGIYFLEMDDVGSIIENMSPLENICLGSYHKISRLGIPKKKVLRYLKKDFISRYEEEKLIEKKDSWNLYRRERIALNLYRINIMRPKIIFCSDYNNNDVLTTEMINHWLMEQLKENVSICMITTNRAYKDTIADEYMVLEEED